MGIDPDNYLVLNIATTGVKPPIGVLEIAGRFGESEEPFQYFVEPDDIMIPSDLNYAYTRIPRYLYDNKVTDGESFLDEFLPLMREMRPEIVIINNDWWFDRVSKDPANRKMSAFFPAVRRKPIFPISVYEKARTGSDYTIFSRAFEFYHELLDDMKRASRQAAKGIAVSVETSYAERGGPERECGESTAAQIAVDDMVYIWENILNNNEEQENYR